MGVGVGAGVWRWRWWWWWGWQVAPVGRRPCSALSDLSARRQPHQFDLYRTRRLEQLPVLAALHHALVRVRAHHEYTLQRLAAVEQHSAHRQQHVPHGRVWTCGQHDGRSEAKRSRRPPAPAAAAAAAAAAATTTAPGPAKQGELARAPSRLERGLEHLELPLRHITIGRGPRCEANQPHQRRPQKHQVRAPRGTGGHGGPARASRGSVNFCNDINKERASL